jgi:signal transduction histidine kinase
MLFAIGLVALVAILIATALLVSSTARNADEVVQGRKTRAAIVDLKSLVQDAEIGQRGYLLTGRESYLEPFEHARTEIGPRFLALRERLSAFPEDAGKVELLAGKLREKLAELSQTVALVREGKSAEARDIVDSGIGKTLMDEARTVIDALTLQADRRFADSVERQRASGDALQWVELVGAIIIFSVVGGAAWIVMTYTRELGAARTEIETLNVGLEEKVRDRTRDLGRANEEIQRFAYIVTHDLRAPLVNIMGFTSELETSLKPIQALVAEADGEGRGVAAARLAANEDLPEAIGFIRSSTRKMDGLINAILKLSRDGKRQLKPERVELASLLQMAADAVQHQVTEAGGRVDLDVGVPSIVSDRISIEQVVGNLIDNAVKYSAENRPLRIAVRSRQAPANRVVIEIEDNGRGIAPQDHERVFELFRRSGTQDKPGEGIGLAHVRSSVRGLGGDVTLKSKVGEGTTFFVDLPRDLKTFLRSTQP